VGDRETVLLRHSHVHPWHQGKVKRHVAFITVLALAITEIQLRIFRPLVRLGQQHAVWIIRIDLGTNLLEHVVRLLQPQPIDAHVQPVTHHFEHRFHDLRVVEVQVWLVRVKPVPEVLTGHRVPGPVGFLSVEKDDP
nr:hypothetical protein [Tanacetum cinerariifolium]